MAKTAKTNVVKIGFNGVLCEVRACTFTVVEHELGSRKTTSWSMTNCYAVNTMLLLKQNQCRIIQYSHRINFESKTVYNKLQIQLGLLQTLTYIYKLTMMAD